MHCVRPVTSAGVCVWRGWGGAMRVCGYVHGCVLGVGWLGGRVREIESTSTFSALSLNPNPVRASLTSSVMREQKEPGRAYARIVDCD